MRLPVQIIFPACMMLTLCSATAPAWAESYSLFDSPYGYAYVLPTGINAKGVVAGYGNEVQPSFIRAVDGSIELFEVKHSGPTAATAINAKGWVAGSDQSSDMSHYDGFIRKPNGHVIKIPAPAGTSLYVQALNNSGDVCGYVLNLPNTGVYYGFLRTVDGAFIELERNDAGRSACTGINDSGAVAGFFAPTKNEGAHGFIRAAEGSITTFDLPDKSPVGALSINAAGDVAGANVALCCGQPNYAFVRLATDGSFRTFSTPDTGDMFYTVFINARGVVAGTYYHPDGFANRYHGFVAQPGGQAVRFDAPGLDGSTVAVGLNDKGEIAGLTVNNDHQSQGFIREP